MSEIKLKPIDPETIPRALMRAERYRLLGEPEEAESICQDILMIDAECQQAMITLLLALTDQFRNDRADCCVRAQALVPRITGDYERGYYAGIICERRGSALLDNGGPGSGPAAHGWLQEAMEWYEKAEAIRPAQNDDAILRWNTCARIIMKYHLRSLIVDNPEPVLQE